MILRRTFLLGLLAAVLPWLPAQAPATGPYRVAGQIVNAKGGEPVARTRIALLAEDNGQIVASTLSDAEGHFAFDRLPADKFPLTASHRGYRTSFYDEHEGFNSAIVTGEGQDTEHLVFRLPPAAVISGTVSADEGDPVVSAQVLLLKHPDVPDDRPPQIEQAITDDTGAYEFANLAAGSYSVAVTAEPWYAMRPNPATTSPLDVAFAVTYFDSTIDEGAAKPITVAAGDREHADIMLHAIPAVRITLPRKTVGNQVTGVQVHQAIFGLPMPAGNQESYGGPNGTIQAVGLAPGHYFVTHGQPVRTVEINAATSAEVPPESGSPSATVSGTLRSSSGPLTGAFSVMLQPIPQNGARNIMMEEAHDGRFQIANVPQGAWRVLVNEIGSGARSLPAVSIIQAGKSTAADQFTVADTPVTVAITVSHSLHRIQGFARRDGKAAPGAMILLVPRIPAAYPSLARRDQSDSDGSFNLRDVPPGQYTVIALQDGWKLNWQDRRTIERYLPQGVPVEVAETSGASAIPLPRAVEAVAP